MIRVSQPIRPIGHESPCSNMRDPVGERIDVAVGPISLSNLTSEPVDGDVTLSHQESIEGYGQFCMSGWRNLAIVWNLTNIPQAGDCCRVTRQFAHILVARGMFENQDVFASRRACQSLLVWRRRKRGLQSADRSKIKIGVAPLQQPNGLKAVTFESLNKLRFKRIAASRRAKCAVPRRATGATG